MNMQLYWKYMKSSHFKYMCVATSGYMLMLGYASKEAFSYGKHVFCPAAVNIPKQNSDQFADATSSPN